mmetsp:Transcript_7322/g.22157  ORF Transcript_7322/g.22157 Transcript_7322/m.22157 type:complete len:379 (-) Transcript_7322:337-1473(-)
MPPYALRLRLRLAGVTVASPASAPWPASTSPGEVTSPLSAAAAIAAAVASCSALLLRRPDERLRRAASPLVALTVLFRRLLGGGAWRGATTGGAKGGSVSADGWRGSALSEPTSWSTAPHHEASTPRARRATNSFVSLCAMRRTACAAPVFSSSGSDTCVDISVRSAAMASLMVCRSLARPSTKSHTAGDSRRSVATRATPRSRAAGSARSAACASRRTALAAARFKRSFTAAAAAAAALSAAAPTRCADDPLRAGPKPDADEPGTNWPSGSGKKMAPLLPATSGPMRMADGTDLSSATGAVDGGALLRSGAVSGSGSGSAESSSRASHGARSGVAVASGGSVASRALVSRVSTAGVGTMACATCAGPIISRSHSRTP